MNYRATIFLLAAVITGGISFAQNTQNAALDDFKAASSNQQGKQ